MADTIKFRTKGSLKKTSGFLERIKEFAKFGWLDKYGKRGVDALRKATPRDSGLLSESWKYKIEHTKEGATLYWYNEDIEGGCNVAILIEYGHATKSGSYVAGQHFVHDAIEPIFDEIVVEIEREMILNNG